MYLFMFYVLCTKMFIYKSSSIYKKEEHIQRINMVKNTIVNAEAQTRIFFSPKILYSLLEAVESYGNIAKMMERNQKRRNEKKNVKLIRFSIFLFLFDAIRKYTYHFIKMFNRLTKHVQLMIIEPFTYINTPFHSQSHKRQQHTFSINADGTQKTLQIIFQ